MISEAISTLKERTGSSQQAIVKLIEEKYKKVLPPNFKKLLSVQLKKFVKSERLVKVKNSYKISSTEKLKLVINDDLKNKKKENSMASPPSKQKSVEKISSKGVKTKRLSQVKTPEGLKKSKNVANKKAVAAGKTKPLTQVKTPEFLKRANSKKPVKSASVTKKARK